RIYPPLLANTGVSLRQEIGSLQSVFQETGGHTIEVTNREYQLRVVVNNDDIGKLEYLVAGRNKEDKLIYLRDVGYIQFWGKSTNEASVEWIDRVHCAGEFRGGVSRSTRTRRRWSGNARA